MPTSEDDRRLISFFMNGGIVYSGPHEGRPFFWKGAKLVVSIRQSFFALGGYRVPGWGHGTFIRAKSLGLIAPIVKNPLVFTSGSCKAEVSEIWYGLNRRFVQ